MHKVTSIKSVDFKGINLGEQGLNADGVPKGYTVSCDSVQPGQALYRFKVDTSKTGNTNLADHWEDDQRWLAVQVGIDLHAMDKMVFGINHACRGNVRFEPGDDGWVKVVAIRDIPAYVEGAKREDCELAFNYDGNELAMHADIACACVTCREVVVPGGNSHRIHGAHDAAIDDDIRFLGIIRRELPDDPTKMMPHMRPVVEEFLSVNAHRNSAMLRVVKFFEAFDKAAIIAAKQKRLSTKEV